MKTMSRNYRYIIVLFFSSVFVTMSASANKQVNDTPVIEFRYIGVIGDQPVFQLDLNNTKKENVLVLIKDQSGTTLYSEKTKAMVFTRKFELNKEDLWNSELHVMVKPGKSKPQVFAIHMSMTISPELIINRM